MTKLLICYDCGAVSAEELWGEADITGCETCWGDHPAAVCPVCHWWTDLITDGEPKEWVLGTSLHRVSNELWAFDRWEPIPSPRSADG